MFNSGTRETQNFKKQLPVSPHHSTHIQPTMAERRRKFKIPLVTPEQQQKIKRKLDIKNFDVNAILRGAQLTVVGGLRALQNPALFTSEHYKQAALAVAIAIAITIVISIPVKNNANRLL